MNENDDIAVTFQAVFAKAVTLQDGSWRLTLDLQEGFDKTISDIASLRGKILQVALVPIDL